MKKETAKDVKDVKEGSDVEVDTTLTDRIVELENTIKELTETVDASTVTKDQLEEQIEGLNTDVTNLDAELQVVTRERNDALQAQIDITHGPQATAEATPVNLENIFSTISHTTTDEMVKTTSALPLHNGCLVQATSVWKETGTVSESIIFVPNTKITEQLNDDGQVVVRYLSPLNQV